MKKYYAKTTVNMQAKNKAWEEIQKFAHEQNGTLIYGEQALRDFITAASVKVDEINGKYPRCKDIKFNSHTVYNLNIYGRVDLDDAFNIEFLPIKKELPAPASNTTIPQHIEEALNSGDGIYRP